MNDWFVISAKLIKILYSCKLNLKITSLFTFELNRDISKAYNQISKATFA